MAGGRHLAADRRSTEPARRPAVLIYDGECAVCRSAAAWVRERAAADAFEYLSCHSEELAHRFPAIPRDACLAAMHLVLPDGTVLAGEKAVPEILSRLKGRRHRWAAAFFRLPGAGVLSRRFYRWFAARRHRVARLLGP
ncbi:MAG: thiol-disulfide oxidoreductase DCC family protein [Gemmatimonadota bacterium]